MSSREEFINWLQHEMNVRGWDQVELTRRAKLPTGVLSRVMSLERQPSPATLRSIAQSLQIPPEELFRRAGLLPRSAGSPPEGADELLSYYQKAGEDDRRRMIAVVKALYESGLAE